jgi:hypothetical protein
LRISKASCADRDAFDDDRLERAVPVVSRDAGDGFNNLDRCVIALAEDGVVAVETVDGMLGDKELAGVRVGAALA